MRVVVLAYSFAGWTENRRLRERTALVSSSGRCGTPGNFGSNDAVGSPGELKLLTVEYGAAGSASDPIRCFLLGYNEGGLYVDVVYAGSRGAG